MEGEGRLDWRIDCNDVTAWSSGDEKQYILQIDSYGALHLSLSLTPKQPCYQSLPIPSASMDMSKMTGYSPSKASYTYNKLSAYPSADTMQYRRWHKLLYIDLIDLYCVLLHVQCRPILLTRWRLLLIYLPYLFTATKIVDSHWF